MLRTSLPPDPVAAGMDTREDNDSDNNGVRDDVQRLIAMTYPNSEKTRTASIRMTKTMQLFLLDITDPQLSNKHAMQISRI